MKTNDFLLFIFIVLFMLSYEVISTELQLQFISIQLAKSKKLSRKIPQLTTLSK